MMPADAARLRRGGRLAGALYLVVVLSGLFCLAYVPSRTGATLLEARAQADLFRAGIAAFLLMQVAFLLVPLALYRVLADAGREAAVLMVALAVASVPVGLVAATHRMEALALVQGSAEDGTAQAAFAAAMERYGHGLRIASLFWGLWLLPFGMLVLRSGRLPRLLGGLLVLGGAWLRRQGVRWSGAGRPGHPDGLPHAARGPRRDRQLPVAAGLWRSHDSPRIRSAGGVCSLTIPCWNI